MDLTSHDTRTDPTITSPTAALDAALTHIVHAAAAFNRAGPHYATSTESLWFFAAGSWTPWQYQYRVNQASKELPKRVCVNSGVAFAREQLEMAEALLRKDGDVRDARDLEECVGLMRLGQGAW